MSTDIKPGQEVRAVRDTQSAFSSDIDAGTRCVVKDPNYDGGGRYSVAEAGYTLSVYRVGDAPKNTLLVKPEDFEPAPLDPSKVREGDTVTLNIHDPEMAPFEVQGPAYDGPEGVMAGAWPLVGHPHVTLTDHQPAPEPEPEWKPGTFVSATIWAGAKSKSEKRDVCLVRASNEEFPWYDPEEHDFYKDDVLTAVRPLVVIDPADVDVDALLDSTLARLRDDPHVPTTYTVLKTALSVLGIEVP